MTVCLLLVCMPRMFSSRPHRAPLPRANTLGIGNNLLLVMGLGVLVSIPALAAAYFYAQFIGKKVKAADEADVAADVRNR